MIKFCVALLLVGCAGSVDEKVEVKQESACHEFGEAPEVTTIRQPPSQPAPHPECVRLEEMSAVGQAVWCCEGQEFDTWYASVGPAPSSD